MSEPAAISSRLIGEIFVERGLVTREQLEEALVVQKETGSMLGEVLVATFGVSRIELASVLAEQWSAMEREPEDERRPVVRAVPSPPPIVEEPIDAASRRPIGEIFVEQGLITEEQLERALEQQRETGERLGETLVRLGLIERLGLAGALAEQWSALQKIRPPSPSQPAPWQEVAVRTAPGVGEGSPAEDELDGLRQSVRSLQTQLAALASRPDPDLTALRAETRAVEDRLQGIEERLAALTESEALADLAATVEEVRRHVEAIPAADPADEIERLTERLDALAPDDALLTRLDALERSLDEVVGLRDELARIDVLEREAARAEDVENVRRALEEASPELLREQVDAVAATVAELSARLETHATDTGRDDDLHDLRERLAAGQRALEALSARLDVVAESAEGRATETAQALALQAIEELEGRTDERLGELRARLEAVEVVDSAPDGDPGALDALRGAVDRLDSRTNEIAARLAEVQGAERLDGLLADVPTRGELDSAVAALAGRVDALAGDLDASARDERLDGLAESLATMRGRFDELAAGGSDSVGRAELSSLLEDIRARLGVVEGAVGPDERVEGLARLLDVLVERIAAVEAGGSHAVDRTEVDSLFHDLRARLDAVDGALGAVGRDERVDGLAEALSTMRARVDELGARAAEAVRRAELEALTQDVGARLDELSDAVARTGASERMEGMARLLDVLVERVSAVEAGGSGAVGRVEVDSLLDDLRSRLDAVDGALGAVGRDERVDGLVEALADVRGRLDELGARGAEAVGRPELSSLADELRARLEVIEDAVGGAGTDERVEGLARLLDVLVERLAAVETGTGDAVGRAELDVLLHDLRADLSGLAGSLAELRDDSGVADLEEGLAEVRARLEAVAARGEGAVAADHLAAVGDDLRARLDALGGELAAVRDDGRAAELDAVLAALTERVAAIEFGASTAVDRAELSAATASLAMRLDELAGEVATAGRDDRLDGLAESLAALHLQVDELAARGEDAADRVELSALAGDVAARLEELRRMVDTAGADGRVEAIEGSLSELRAWLEAVQGRLDDTVGRTDLEAVAGDLRAQLDGLGAALAELREDRATAELAESLAAVRAWLEQVAARADAAVGRTELAVRDDDLRARSDAVAERVEGLAHHLDASLVDLRTALDSGLAARAAGERVDALAAELSGRLAGVDERLGTLAGHDALEALAADLAQRIAALDAIAREASGLAAGAVESARAATDERLADVVGRTELGAVTADLDARLHAVAAAGADASAQVATGLDALAIELREGLAHLHTRIDELAAGLGHTGGRLAALEQVAAHAGTVDELAADLAALRAHVGQETTLADERARATERAIRKGLAGLGERLVAGEQAYLETGAALRRSLERLGAAVVEADARIVGEPLDPPAAGYVAFLPTADGYRLTPLEGIAPAVGELLELAPGEPALRVVRVTVSPLPLDRRPCVYLETT